ncbi:CdaR family protein [Alkalitalea saponilacus]|nr:CdaR family protein [Alkalitalea saponilacus]ASB50874.1 hypothetical protein CDL62_17825 [Alkalitalea saponilacus]
MKLPYIEKIKSMIGHYIQKWPTSLKKIQKNKDALIFLIFLFISTAFWFFNALRDDYTTEISYPVRFVNLPENKVITEASNDKVIFRIRANGYAILRQFLGGTRVPMNYDVSQLRRTNRRGEEFSFILAREQQGLIRDQLLVGIELLSIEPDTIFIKLDQLVTKDFPIRMNGKIELEKQFLIAGNIIFNPDSVKVSGPKQILDTLTHVPTQPFNADRLRETTSRRVGLKPINQLQYNLQHTNVTIPVEPFSEQTMSVPLHITGLPDTLRIKTFPPEIRVTFRAGLSQFERIHFSDFIATVDGSVALRPDRPQRLRVRLEQTPENVYSVDYSPLFVEYLIERRR